ncbi:gloverin-like [Ostrinia furnacalis]|uniref:Gloverin n=1 Tax=Ostrinia furnacalis TaxID=93504 RepID=A0A3G2BAG8_OSTFU|nr:gloverin-like [Ostrinia furnacalis]XP_028168251.1 gloverin-like [Ostrinia furnacalis]AYM26645.1 gloverin [Ostrinia furnacalis]
MQVIIFSALLMVAAAQEFYVPPYAQDTGYLLEEPMYNDEHAFTSDGETEPLFGVHPRFRREVSIDPKTGDLTADHKMDNGRVFGTVGSNDAGLFGKAGYEHNIFDDARGKMDAQAFGTRTLGPYGDSSALGGALKWRDDHAQASFDINKQVHGPTSWTAAGGGHWPVGKNGDFGLEGTYSRMAGMNDYGGRAVYNYRW